MPTTKTAGRSLPLLLALVAGFAASGPARVWAQASEYSRPADLTIYSSDGQQILGRRHYDITKLQGGVEVRGESRYLNGEYDIELEKVEFSPQPEMARLVTFSHRFFLADGELQLTAEADLKSGASSCFWRDDGKERGSGTVLSFPAGTYAGASLLIPIEDALRQGVREGIRFHAFACTPKPRIVAVVAAVDKTDAPWSSYRSGCTRVEVQPDFGWLNVLAGPFLPKFYAWFDPNQDWMYLGGRIERFYRGPVLELVRELPGGNVPPASAALPQQPTAR